MMESRIHRESATCRAFIELLENQVKVLENTLRTAILPEIERYKEQEHDSNA